MRKSVYRRNHSTKIIIGLILLCVIIIIAGVATFVIRSVMPPEMPSNPTVVAEKDTPKTEKTTTASFGAVGNIMLHKPFLTAPAYQKEGDYDFSPIFTLMEDVYQQFDFMSANLETTFPGWEAGYSGAPTFRSPDSLALALKGCGIDLFQFANNQIYDSGISGFVRTMEFLKEQKIDYTGIRYSLEEKAYSIQQIKNIKVGVINYTYETPRTDQFKAINGDPLDPAAAERLNSFDPENPEPFYHEMEQNISAMKEDGAEFITAYLHWGHEYQQEPAGWQKEMAQKLCDMGVDVIIGSHPYVLQPVDVLTSSDGKHQMLCAYSLGNHLSNQRKEYMPALPQGQSEDGLVLGLTLTKTSEGTVSLSKVDFIPTWVYRNAAGPEYYILPLTDMENLKALEENTGFTGIAEEAWSSYQRTETFLKDSKEKIQKIYRFQ